MFQIAKELQQKPKQQGRRMQNAKIIRVDQNIFRGKTKEHKLFDSRISNITAINNATIIRFENDVYGGETKDGKPHGKGILRYYHNGKAEGRYIGEFKDGKRDGQGKWIIDESSYEGEWKLDEFHGKGKFVNRGDIQEGFWFMGSFECEYGEELEPCNYIEIKND